MLLSETELKARIESPLNLLNRLRLETSSKSKSVSIPCIPPTAEELINDLDKKLDTSTARSKATELMSACLDELKVRLPEIAKPKELAEVAERMSKIVNAPAVRLEDNRKQAQIIIYSPRIVDDAQYEVVDGRD